MSPNPASNSVSIDLPANVVDGTLLIGVFDVSGANVLFTTASAESGTIQLNTTALATGSYLVRITQLSGRPVASDQLIIGR